MGSLCYNPKAAICSVLHHRIPADPLIDFSRKGHVTFWAPGAQRFVCLFAFKEHLFHLTIEPGFSSFRGGWQTEASKVLLNQKVRA